MKKTNFKTFTLGMLVGSIFISSFTNTSLAKSLKESIKVTYNDIKLVVDNKPVKLGKDAKGNTIEPFIYNGVTYLPVRSVGEALGKDVNWDGSSKTVYIGNFDKKAASMTDVLKPHYKTAMTIYDSKSSEKLNIAGKDYSTGFHIHTFGPGSVYYNLNSEYEELEFDYGPASGYGYESTNKILIYADDELKHSFEVDPKDNIKKAKISLKGVNQLRIESSGKYPGIGIGNPIIR